MKHVKCPSCGNGVQFTIDSEGYSVCPACNYHLPREIGHFKLVELLGTGGMGAVFRGIDTSLQREVAVKIMREEMTQSEKFVADFLREARATAVLNHPNIAKIYDGGIIGSPHPALSPHPMRGENSRKHLFVP
jgi:serine/threonine protein kinase